MSGEALFEVEALNVTYVDPRRSVRAVRDVSFALGRERLGIVGESGSGKSTLGRALLGLVQFPGIVEAQTLKFQGRDLKSFKPAEWQALRGRHVSMVMQDAKYSLNPVRRVGEQIMETYRLHNSKDRREARRRALEMLDAVRIREPEAVFDLYPHQLSGGMGQRAMIAMMLIGNPEALIADEPTSSLDVTVQNQVLRVMDELVAKRGMGLILISHNLSVVSSFCDRILVMYGGRIVESLDRDRLESARHPYTRALFASAPSLTHPVETLSVVKRDPAWAE